MSERGACVRLLAAVVGGMWQKQLAGMPHMSFICRILLELDVRPCSQESKTITRRAQSNL